MSQPTLRTARLTLVPLAEEHLEHEVELDSDPEVMRYLGNGRARTRVEVEQRHAERLAVPQRAPGLGFWAGFLPGGEFVGWWLLEPPEPGRDVATREAELGYRLLRRHWRQGLASEGARELLRYGFEELDLDRIFAETMAVNTGSRATMTAIGMTYVRAWSGEVEYAVTRAEWSALTGRHPESSNRSRR